LVRQTAQRCRRPDYRGGITGSMPRSDKSSRIRRILKDGRAVFNIAGNKYRIVVWINYPYRVVYIRFIGTHRQYDAIDAETV
jgi:mRNA-degrading endonuclease HigB of HigAB toxin-antitoxin module